VREYLEKHYKPEAVENEHLTLKLAIKSLSEVVQSGAQNIELVIMTWDSRARKVRCYRGSRSGLRVPEIIRG